MFRQLSNALKIVLVLVLGASILAGCSGQSAVGGYPLLSVSKNGNQESYIYQADNQTVPEVAKKLSGQRKPEQMSKTDSQQMFLVYSNELYDIQKDKKNPNNTVIEVSNKAFVDNNYSSSFLKGYLSAVLLDQIFQLGQNAVGNYRGYTNSKTYPSASKYRRPTVQEKKVIPPITKQTTGSIIRRSNSGSNSNTVSSTLSKIGTSVSKDMGQAFRSVEKSTGKIFKANSGSGSNKVAPKSSTISIPKNNSPPKIKTGGFGKIIKRSR